MRTQIFIINYLYSKINFVAYQLCIAKNLASLSVSWRFLLLNLFKFVLYFINSLLPQYSFTFLQIRQCLKFSRNFFHQLVFISIYTTCISCMNFIDNLVENDWRNAYKWVWHVKTPEKFTSSTVKSKPICRYLLIRHYVA